MKNILLLINEVLNPSSIGLKKFNQDLQNLTSKRKNDAIEMKEYYSFNLKLVRLLNERGISMTNH